MPSFTDLTLDTTRLRLRPLGEPDAEPLFRIFGDPEVMRYWSKPPWRSIEEARDLVDRDRDAMAAGEYVRLGIERKEDSALIGTCSLFAFSEPCRRAEIGFALAREAWGRGYMNEALRALLRHGFDGLDLNRVEADVDPRNEASARALRRLGFELEGHLRERWIVDGEVADTAFYGLLRRDWGGSP